MNGREYDKRRVLAGEHHDASVDTDGPSHRIRCVCGFDASALSRTAAEMIRDGHLRDVALSRENR